MAARDGVAVVGTSADDVIAPLGGASGGLDANALGQVEACCRARAVSVEGSQSGEGEEG